MLFIGAPIIAPLGNYHLLLTIHRPRLPAQLQDRCEIAGTVNRNSPEPGAPIGFS